MCCHNTSVDFVSKGYCHLQVDQGSCKALIPAWYYDHLTGQCSQFQYGGCGGNENRFTSQEVCESSCSRESKSVIDITSVAFLFSFPQNLCVFGEVILLINEFHGIRIYMSV